MYSNYLSYLKHVDDATLQDFQNELNKLRDRYTGEIQQLKEDHSKSLEAEKKNHIAKEQSLRESLGSIEDKHKKAIQQLNDEHSRILDQSEQELKKNITELKRKLTLEKNRYTKEKNRREESEAKASLYERLYESSRNKLKRLSIYRAILTILVSVGSLGALPAIYFILYLPLPMLLKRRYFSVIKWIRCNRYDSGWVARKK